MLRKALEMEHFCLYRGSVSSTWREGSYTEDFERLGMEGYGSISVIGLHMGNLTALAR